MATEQRILKQDGYLDVGNAVESRNIAYHPHLNVILVFDYSNQVKILDVHSGVILQTYKLGGNGKNIIEQSFTKSDVKDCETKVKGEKTKIFQNVLSVCAQLGLGITFCFEFLSKANFRVFFIPVIP